MHKHKPAPCHAMQRTENLGASAGNLVILVTRQALLFPTIPLDLQYGHSYAQGRPKLEMHCAVQRDTHCPPFDMGRPWDQGAWGNTFYSAGQALKNADLPTCLAASFLAFRITLLSFHFSWPASFARCVCVCVCVSERVNTSLVHARCRFRQVAARIGLVTT